MKTVKALQEIETIQINKNIPKTIMIQTDSRITLDSLKNMKTRNYLIEAIRKKTIALEKENWYIECTWIKARAGHERNELADKLTKETTRNSVTCCNTMLKCETAPRERDKHRKVTTMGQHHKMNSN
jgi:ribonuclease HI